MFVMKNCGDAQKPLLSREWTLADKPKTTLLSCKHSQSEIIFPFAIKTMRYCLLRGCLQPQHFTVFNEFILITNRSNQTKYNENTYVLMFRFLLCSKKIGWWKSHCRRYIFTHVFRKGCQEKASGGYRNIRQKWGFQGVGKKLTC